MACDEAVAVEAEVVVDTEVAVVVTEIKAAMTAVEVDAEGIVVAVGVPEVAAQRPG